MLHSRRRHKTICQSPRLIAAFNWDGNKKDASAAESREGRAFAREVRRENSRGGWKRCITATKRDRERNDEWVDSEVGGPVGEGEAGVKVVNGNSNCNAIFSDEADEKLAIFVVDGGEGAVRGGRRRRRREEG